MSWRTIAVFTSLICGPFVSVGITVSYRRALQWWYVNQFAIEQSDAEFMSWMVLLCVACFIGFSVLMRETTHGGDAKRWWWEPKP